VSKVVHRLTADNLQHCHLHMNLRHDDAAAFERLSEKQSTFFKGHEL
jgi:hypothetical protein